MIVYSHSITPRLQYIVDFLSSYYSHHFTLTSSIERYLASKEGKINYSHEHLSEGELYIYPHSLLFETGKRPVVAECFIHNGYKAFFKSNSVTGFDLFAAIFFLITRYEEYLPHSKDEYGRYDYKNSIAFKEGFLQQPLINIWLEDFRTVLLTKDASITARQTFSFTPSYDIDIAWSYLNKGAKRNAGGFLRDITQRKWWYVRKRWRVIRKKEQDPFDAYDWLDEMHAQYHLQPYYFFPVAEKINRYDKNIEPQNEAYRQLIKSHAAKYKIGLHPSWQSGDHPNTLKLEFDKINAIAEQTITSSRQHFIRLALPLTYRRLIALGIRDEFSMGYGSTNGFRASFACSFYWYDVEKDEKTSLLIHPFCFMDANSFFEQHFTPEQALQEALGYYNTIKELGGNFITIWHTPFLGTDKLFEGWKEVYEQLIEKVTA